MGRGLEGVGGRGAEELAHARTEPERAGERARAPAPGTEIGRFIVGEVLGTGGMGVVISARDPNLDREVALKLVRARGDEPAETRDGRARLLREARAMAKLRHPNVLTVYEAGTHGDDVYVAMERVEDGTLRDALARAGSDWRTVVRLFAAAGRGLAAAHRAGLVHRDFKPDNVLVEGERVLVADFGLVGTVHADDEELDHPRDSGADGDSDSDRDGGGLLGGALTRAGQVVGTPAYMAPEQHDGDRADARSDQFAFCVALYEGLYGQLPFRGRTRARYLRAIRRGAVRPPRPVNAVPSWIHDAVVRGLRHDPRRRFSGMDALLAALVVDAEDTRLGARRRTLGVATVALAVIAWAGASAFVDYELTYRAMAIIDAACLVLIALFGLVSRAELAAVAFNRRVVWTGAAVAGAVLALVAGGWIAGIPQSTTALLHLFTTFCFATAAAILLDARLWIVAAGYLAAFGAAGARFELFFPASFAAHGLMGIVLYVVLSGRGARRVAPGGD